MKSHWLTGGAWNASGSERRPCARPRFSPQAATRRRARVARSESGGAVVNPDHQAVPFESEGSPAGGFAAMIGASNASSSGRCVNTTRQILSG